MELVKKVKRSLLSIISLLLITYLIIFIPCFFGIKPLVIISGSMEPTLRVGGLMYYEKDNINKNYKENDIIVYQTKKYVISHRVVKKTNSGYITKGDANNNIDSIEISRNKILGKGKNWSIPYLGYYADFIYNNKKILLIIIIILSIDSVVNNYKKDV